MTKKKFTNKIDELAKLQGYIKPEFHSGVLKLDSNENFVINKQLQQDLINTAQKSSDIREYPLGRAEKLIESIADYVGLTKQMVGVGNVVTVTVTTFELPEQAPCVTVTV